MELEEIQATWAQMGRELEKQKRLTDEIIVQMTQQRYSGRFDRISTYETIGAALCFAVVVLILANFGKLDTWYLKACGVFTLAVLLILPVLVLRSLGQLKQLDIAARPYAETVVRFARTKKRLMAMQQFSVYISFVLMFATTAVFTKITSGKDFFIMEKEAWLYGLIAFVVVFLAFFAHWGYRSYKNVTESAENILRELE